MKRATLYLIVGAMAGALTFVVSEPFSPRTGTDAAWQRHGAIFSIAAGMLIAACIGAASGRLQGSKTHILRGLGMGLLGGLIFGPIGFRVGNMIFAKLGGQDTSFISRVPGWAAFGVFIGLAGAVAEGFVAQSMKRTYQAVVGGLVGGVVGGFAFEIAALVFGSTLAAANQSSGDIAGPARAVGLVCLGAAIGLCIGIAEALSRSAKVRLVLGRNEGKEWPVDAQNTVIGRSETAHIPLLGDPNVALHHASILKQGGQFVLVDAGSPMGTGLNGFQIQNSPLTSGDVINIAGLQLIFTIAGQTARTPQVQHHPQQFQPMPNPVPQTPLQPTQMMQPLQQTQAMSAPQATTNWTIVATTGPLNGQRFPVAGGLELGRASIQVPLAFDNHVSRSHATITIGPNGPIIMDAGSQNGTQVNGTKISQKELAKGDLIQIGSTVFRVE